MDIRELAGTRLGSYEIEGLLGEGGMGVVYKARQLSLDRSVALKILPPTLSADASYVKRFQREARAVAQLHHPNIVQIHDIAEEEGLHFFSMEYMEGKTLDELLKEKGRLEPGEAIRIISQAAQGIQHAHKGGIIHRDIKPSNIILDELGNVRVMDFGLARMTEERSKLTQSGTLMGTLDYMSPEQCRGEELDESTDIYSLGVVLYEMLTGEPPFEAPNEAALINKVINEEAPEASNINPDVPQALSRIASRAMAKNKNDRYGVVSEFLENIQGLGASLSSAVSTEERRSPSIAVLPFVNMSADPEQEYFCEGISEELINALCKLEGLKVASRTSAFQFEGKGYDIKDVGARLSVATVLEGSVRKSGNRLRITAQLVDVSDGYHLWSERYDREMDDVFAIQDEITLAIVSNLKPTLLREEKARLAKRQTVDMEAYNLYLKGRYFWNLQRPEDANRAIEYFERAIEKTPNYALAFAGLADSYGHLPFWIPIPPKEVFPKAREWALKALEIDSEMAEAIASLAYIEAVFDWDWENAEKKFRRAIELSPGYAPAHHRYAYFLMYFARLEEAIDEINIALDLDPLSFFINMTAVEIFRLSGRYDQAEEAIHRMSEIEPASASVPLQTALLYFSKWMSEEGMEHVQRFEDSVKDLSTTLDDAMIGCLYAASGEQGRARTILDDLLERAKESYFSRTGLAALHFMLGEIDKGFEWLEKAYDDRDPFLCYLRIEPLFGLAGLHSDPRYIAMLKKIGLDK
jgi:serine/threonine protein kinase/Tfp pilus assembly protein PilF